MNDELLMDYLETSFGGARFLRLLSTLRYCCSLPGREKCQSCAEQARVGKDARGFIGQAIF
jgi:hypothetical protein